ncbi:hypothetical protein [Devosia sp. DBB001]|nr:hypothetical protein [Devosia sp. DBB001]
MARRAGGGCDDGLISRCRIVCTVPILRTAPERGPSRSFRSGSSGRPLKAGIGFLNQCCPPERSGDRQRASHCSPIEGALGRSADIHVAHRRM